MGDAQSAQREGRQDAAAAEEESGKVDDAQTKQNTEDKLLKNNEQINGKTDGAIENVNGQCEDEIAAEAVLSPDEDVSETAKPLQQKPPLKKVLIDKKESPTEADAKQNDINESFRKFFSNIGVKLTVKKGSSEIATDVSDETNKDKPNRPENIKEIKSGHAELNTDVNIAQETCDNDSTTCPTLTDGTSEDTLENAGEKKIETKEEVESAATMSPLGEEAHLDATPEDKPHSTSPQSPEEEVVVTPIKRFFTTGIFSGLRKKKKPADNEATEKEQIDMEKTEVIETSEQTVQDQKQDKEEISPGVEAASVDAEHKDKENELKAEILSAASAQTTDEGKSSSTDPSTIIVTEPEILSSQERDKVQASPLKRLLSGSSLKKLSKKQRSRRSSDAKVPDSGEHISDQLLSSTESPENQKEEGPAQPTAEPAGEEDGAWASFRKKLIKRFSLTNEETQIPGSVEEPKPREGEQISDHSTDEGKKRKDSSVSWEAVLCGSGRRRSRKTSDSEDETPQNDNKGHKQDGGSKDVAESHLESSNENEILASSPRQAFSIKKILPGRKKRKSAEKQDQVSSDEADKDVASGDEDSETPAVVPLSEFDTVEAEVNIQTQADIESHVPEEANSDLQQDLLDQMAEPVLPCDSLQTEAKKVQGSDDTVEKKISTIPEESDDLTESISKHQQLSDIPEEGIITETMGTQASVTEEAAKDDTIAEDLIEITSEAITAPEPASDITLADETEMISAVSQLSSESSKTSGNTTPVPAEYDIMETDTLLHQVVETIAISPMAAPVCSEVPNSEKVVSSLSHQILETFAKEEPTILEIHKKLDATSIKTGLHVEELDAINQLTATSQTESIFEVNNSVSTEVVSETPTEEFGTADTTVDEIQEANITHPEESVKELERIDGSYQLVQCPSEINAAVSTDTLPEGEETVPDVGSLVEAYQAETKDGDIEQEVQTVTEKKDQIMSVNITHQIQVEDQDQPPVEGEELQELAAVQTSTLDSECNVQSLEKDIPVTERVTYELKEEAVPPTEVNVEPEQDDETVAAKTEHSQVPEALKAVPTLDSEESSVQSLEEEVKSEDIPTAETVQDEPKQTAEHVSVEPENKLPMNVVKTENVQEPVALDTVQAPFLKSEEGSVQSLGKEGKTKDVDEVEKVTDEPKQENELRVEPEEKLPVEAEKNKKVQQPEVKPATLDSEEGSCQSLEKEIIAERVPEAKTVTDEPKQENELRVEAEEKLTAEADKTTEVHESDIQAAQSATLASEAGSILSFEKEGTSDDTPAVETATDEPKHENELRVESEKKLPVEADKTEEVQEPEIQVVPEAETVMADKTQDVQEPEIQAVPEAETVTADKTQDVQEPEIQAAQSATLNTEAESPLLFEKEVTSEDIPAVDTPTDEPKHENELRVEAEEKLTVEADKTTEVHEPEIQAVQSATLDSETGSILLLKKEGTSEDIPAVETATDEPKQENELRVESEEKLPVEAAKTEDVQEAEVLPSDVKDTVAESKTDEEALMCMHVVTESTEGGSAQEFEKQILIEDIPKPDINNVTASVTDDIESKVVAQLDQPLEITQDQETASTPQHVRVEQENCIPDVVGELQALTAVHVSSVNNDASNVQVLGETVFSEKTSAPCVDNASATDEAKHEVHLSEVQFSAEQEKESELQGTEKKTAAAQHAVVSQVVVCNLKDVSVSIPDVVMEKTPEMIEPMIDTVVSEQMFKDEVEAATPTDDVAETADKGSVVVMMHAPSVKSEDNHRIQVQVVGVDIKLAKTTVDSVLEIGVTEAKEVIDVCHETVKKVDKHSATPEIEEELISKENKVTIQEVIQHVKEDLPETVPESVVVNLELEVLKQQDAVTKVTETADSESNQTLRERQEEAPAVICDDSAAEQQVSEDLMQTPDIPGHFDVSTHKADLEETEAEREKSEEGVTTEEVKSEELDVKIIHEQAQIAQSQIVAPSNTGLIATQNTGMISSKGNLECPSSLSLEFKLNIQFGQAKEPASPPPSTPRTAPVKQTEVSEVRVQAVEPIKPMDPIHPAESPKQTQLTEVTVQAREIREPAANLDSTEGVVIMTQPMLQECSSQVMETGEPVEQIKSTERVTSSVQATGTVQQIRPTKKTQVSLSKPILSETCDPETKAEEPVKQKEEENDRDVWMDAEEVIYAQVITEVALLEVEEPLKPQTEKEQEELGNEIEIPPDSKNEEGESQQETHKTEGKCEIESEDEDFAVAPEDVESATASVSTMEWD
ncbi:uncharacterized protein akap12a [Chaetodon auriga]|uniref:uncharacterized protein akap12a n=1 Tax=Chaetodon auriga TaxID=39042 RepID=UPI004032992F